MGKKHRHYNGNKQNQPGNETPAETATPTDDQVVTPEAVADMVGDMIGSTEETSSEETAASEAPAEVPAPPEVPAEPAPEPPAEKAEVIENLEQPVEQTVPDPTPAVKKPEPVKPIKRVSGEDVLPSTAPVLKARMNIQPRKTTQQGKRLAAMFDEYAEMMKRPAANREEVKQRVLKLYQVMNFGCPSSLRDAVIATDLVRVAFDKLAEGWGTTFKENTMFQLDYTLPGGPHAIDKLNMYWAAMIQLVEGALYNKRIMFDDGRLALVLKSPIISNAIAKMKANIIERNKNLPPAE